MFWKRGTILALIIPFVGAYWGFMLNERSLTIEILALRSSGDPTVVDRVTGGTIYFDEAKRIGERLLSRTEVEVGYGGYRILNSDLQVLYTWPSGDHAKILS
jgi:hypothetical protein